MATVNHKARKAAERVKLLDGLCNNEAGVWSQPSEPANKHWADVIIANAAYTKDRNKRNRLKRNKCLTKKTWTETIAANHRMYPDFYNKLNYVP